MKKPERRDRILRGGSLAVLVLLILSCAKNGYVQELEKRETAEAARADQSSEELMVRVEGTRVSLVPPAGFTPAQRFSGFLQNDTNASVAITELPNPFTEIRDGFTREALKSRGMTLLGKEDVRISGRDAVLLHLEQRVMAILFRKWIGFLGDEQDTVMVTGTFPASREADLSDIMRRAVLSTHWAAAEKINLFAGLQYTVGESEKLKPAQRVQRMLVYSHDGKPPVEHRPTDPTFFVGPSHSDVAGLDGDERLGAFARARLVQIPLMRDLSVESENAVDIGGQRGWEIVATSTNSETGEPLVAYQVVLVEPGGYVIMLGRVGAGQRAVYLPEFKRLARTFKRK